MRVCLSFYLHMCLSVLMYVCMCVYVCVSISVCVYMYLCMYAGLSIFLSTRVVVYSYADACINQNDTIIKMSDTVLRKIYLSVYLKGLCVRGSWRLNRTATY